MNVLLQWYHLIFPGKWALLHYRKFNDKRQFIKLQIASTSPELWPVNLLTSIQTNAAFTLCSPEAARVFIYHEECTKKTAMQQKEFWV